MLELVFRYLTFLEDHLQFKQIDNTKKINYMLVSTLAYNLLWGSFAENVFPFDKGIWMKWTEVGAGTEQNNLIAIILKPVENVNRWNDTVRPVGDKVMLWKLPWGKFTVADSAKWWVRYREYFAKFDKI